MLILKGFVNKESQRVIENAAARTQKAIDEGRWLEATNYWSITEAVVEEETDGVDFYNVLAPDSSIYDEFTSKSFLRKYSFMRPEICKC